MGGASGTETLNEDVSTWLDDAVVNGREPHANLADAMLVFVWAKEMWGESEEFSTGRGAGA